MALLRAFALELFGSFLLIYVSAWTFTYTRDSNKGDNRTSVFISAASCATIIGLFSYAGSGISKVTLNPIVTLCYILTKNLRLFSGLLLIIAQFGGAFLSSWLLKVMFDKHDLRDSKVKFGDSYSNVIIKDNKDERRFSSTCAIEGMAMLILIILALFSMVQYPRDHILRVLGLTVGSFLGILSVQNTTGASLGPLRVFPQSILNSDIFFKGFWVYWTGPIVGMLVGTIITSFLMAKNLFGIVVIGDEMVKDDATTNEEPEQLS